MQSVLVPFPYTYCQVTAGFLVTIMFTFPMSNFAMRICIHYVFFGESETTNTQHALETIIPFALVRRARVFCDVWARTVLELFVCSAHCRPGCSMN